MTESQLDSLIKSKLKKGYREIAIIADAVLLPTGPQASKIVVAEAAKTQLAKNDPLISALVTRLVTANKHELFTASGGQLDLDLTTGIVSTPLGVVTKENVGSARTLLNDISGYVLKAEFDHPTFIRNVNDYLMLVPQKVGHTRGWHRSFISTGDAVQRQSTLLDQLDASADLAAARLAAAVASGNKNTSVSDVPNLFTAKINKLEDKTVISKIVKMFNEGINRSHESAKLKPIAFYEVELPHAKEAWDRDGAHLTNQWLLWHGTRMFNVLSILKSGLIIPKSGGSFQITGRMFGDGLYFSDQSTKSLNYSYGYWDGNTRDHNCFMFMADVAMGRYHVPGGGYGMRNIPHGYDSCYAKAGTGGVRNNEMIVYRLGQANLRYLVEFDR